MASDKKSTGDNCDCGEGRMRTRSSRQRGDYQLRYLECRVCGATCRCVVKADVLYRKR